MTLSPHLALPRVLPSASRIVIDIETLETLCSFYAARDLRGIDLQVIALG
jgi:hypothetical protein